MRYILLLLPLLYNAALAQQKERTVSVSCYVNPELYLQGSVIAQVTDKAGKTSCSGKYISISNRSRNIFYYKVNQKWLALKPQGKIVVLAGTNTSTSKSPSVYKLIVKYRPDISSSMSAKISNISQMNAQTDQVKARELESQAAKSKQQAANKPSDVAVARVTKPQGTETSKPPTPSDDKDVEKSATAQPKALPPQPKPEPAPEKERVVAKAKPKATPRQTRPQSARVSERNARPKYENAIGLRVDFGDGATGLGPNLRHKFNRNISLDAALVFFEGDQIGLGAQIEQGFPMKGGDGLNWKIGIGPQFLIADENIAVALVPVTGLEYTIPRSALNLSVDWRPNFYLSPGAGTNLGRFGLSLRVGF